MEEREETFRIATEEDPSPEWTEAIDVYRINNKRFEDLLQGLNTFN